MPEDAPIDEKQCRICLDGPEAEFELGRLIRPCLCKGSISFVHVKCLQRWRNMSQSKDAFYACPQCHYHYYFARTTAFGIASNPVAIGALSAFLFTIIVLLSSFLTTYLMTPSSEPSYYFSFHVFPYEVARDLIRAALRILQDVGVIKPAAEAPVTGSLVARPSPGLLTRFINRFILGLPVVGAASLVHMLLSVPLFGPVHWLARYRGSRDRGTSRDIAALVIIILIVIGIAQRVYSIVNLTAKLTIDVVQNRAIYQVYKLTENITKRLLLRAEDAILEVAQ